MKVEIKPTNALVIYGGAEEGCLDPDHDEISMGKCAENIAAQFSGDDNEEALLEDIRKLAYWIAQPEREVGDFWCVSTDYGDARAMVILI